MTTLIEKDLLKIFDLLKPGIEEIKDLGLLFKMYYDKLEHVNFSGSNPYETELLLKYLKQIAADKSMNISLQAFSKSTIDFDNPTQTATNSLVADAFKFYSALRTNHYKLSEIYEIFENFKVEPFSGSYISSATSMSKHDIEDIMKTFEHLKSQWEQHLDNVRSMRVENILTEYIVLPISKSSEISIKTLEHIAKLYKDGNKLSIIDLYSNILTYVFSEVETKTNKPVIQYVMKRVNELKAEVLPPVSRQVGNRKSNTIQLLVQRYRMIPDAPSRPLNELIEDLTGVKIGSGDPLANLKKVAKMISKSRKYGFIVVSKLIPNPIEHNTWLLTDAAYLQKNNLSEPSKSVTTASLRRAETIQNMPKVKPLLKDGIYRIDDTFKKDEPASNFYYVLQTLDGVNFHILFPWYISIFAKKIYEVPADHLKDFGEVKTGPSTRLETYNSILGDEILKHLKTPFVQQEELSRVERKRKEIKWNVIRKKIARSMLEDYKNLFDKHKINQTNIISLILDPQIFQNALHYIIQGISSTIEGLEKRTSTYYSELYMAALSELYKLRSNMSQEVENIYNETYREKINRLLKGDASIRTTIKILDILENVLIEMLEKHLNDKSNVYSIIQQKIEMIELVYSE
jgi:hypothetical protein